MKSRDEVTRKEFAKMMKHHRLIEYEPEDIEELVELVRAYIDKNHKMEPLEYEVSLRSAKTKLNTFYLLYKDEILKRFRVEDEVAEVGTKLNTLDRVTEQVKKYTRNIKNIIKGK